VGTRHWNCHDPAGKLDFGALAPNYHLMFTMLQIAFWHSEACPIAGD
jgi:hypothetical protein